MSDADSIALYVHWPWCLAKCPYCDFNSHAGAPDGDDQERYRNAILRELAHYAQYTAGRSLGSIFFGGGTPSLMVPETVSAILAAATDHWHLDDRTEITLEANPTSFEAAKFRAFRDAGINRVSVGVQALNDEDLSALGREHSAAEALRVIDIAGAIFPRFSFDLIYARPGQGLGAWADELEHALDIAGDHLSLYQLTVEPGTAFFRQNVREADEDLAADLFQLTQDMCEDAGLLAYEVSNHARPGQESRHNLAYWRGGAYIGVGPGAHGRIDIDGVRHATHQIAQPERWLDKTAADGHATAKVRELRRSERIEELVLSGLRLSTGLDAARFTAAIGLGLEDCLGMNRVDALRDEGLLIHDHRGLRTTPQGRLVLNALIQHLLDDIQVPDDSPN